MTTMNGTTASSGNDPESTVSSTIKTVAMEPKTVSGDQGSITNQSLQDIIAADKYLRSASSTKKGNRRKVFKSLFQKMSSPGSRGH